MKAVNVESIPADEEELAEIEKLRKETSGGN